MELVCIIRIIKTPFGCFLKKRKDVCTVIKNKREIFVIECTRSWETVSIKIEKKTYNLSVTDVGDGVEFVELSFILLPLYHR